MIDDEKDAQGSLPERREERPKTTEAEHREWVRREFDEARQEKKKALGFQKKLSKGLDFRKKAMLGGKFTHGTKGKPTHGPRGNQG